MGRAASTRLYPDIITHAGGWARTRMSNWARRVVTSSVVRWTWADMGEAEFAHVLTDYRPADLETVREMMAGRYLLAAKLIDTQGVSPFSTELGTPDWNDELQSFSWLRHFRDARSDAERRFARTLTLDWIGRNRRFSPRNWSVRLTAQRIMNWLRHLDLLHEGAPETQIRAINRLLNQQVQSLKVRVRLTANPTDALMARIALMGAALAQPEAARADEIISQRLEQLHALLDSQFDADALHLSRNASLQVMVLDELITLRNALSRRQSSERLSTLIAHMHSTLAQLTLGNGELAYFNGCGQQQLDLLYALHAQGSAQLQGNVVLSGYGVLRQGEAVVIADSGLVPPPDFARHAHAGALAFEFSHGQDLIVGNCGPAPSALSALSAERNLLRLAPAHSGPEIAGGSSAHIATHGAMADTLLARGPRPNIELQGDDPTLYARHTGFTTAPRITAERWLSLISNGGTLVGKDRFSGADKGDEPLPVRLRFHLGPGVRTERSSAEKLVHLRLPSGALWAFLWDEGRLEITESVRNSVSMGFYRTEQLVLDLDLASGRELTWVLTRQA